MKFVRSAKWSKYLLAESSRYKTVMGGLGRFVGANPFVCILGSACVLAFFISTGAFHWDSETGLEQLYVPRDTRAIKDRAVLERLFPTDYSSLILGHETRINEPFVSVIVETKEGGHGVFDNDLWEALAEIDSIVREDENYVSVCARLREICVENAFLELKPHLDLIRSGAFNLTFPLTLNPVTRTEYFLPLHFGGASVDAGHLSDAMSVRLLYPLDGSNPHSREVEMVLRKKVVSAMEGADENNFTVHAISSLSIEEELAAIETQAIGVIPLSLLLLVVFTVFCSVFDGLPAVAASLLGTVVVALALAIGGAIALMQNHPWQTSNMAGLFIVLGVGMDNVYVMLNAWKRSPTALGVPERMSRCYEEAVVSITLTSATNAGSFFVGALTSNYGTVNLFCVWCGWSILAGYLLTISLFGAVIALMGRAQEWIRSSGWTACAWLHCSSRCQQKGVDTRLGRALGRVLGRTAIQTNSSRYGRSLILVLYVIYLVLSSLSASHLMEGLEKRRLSGYDSYASIYFTLEDGDFRNFGYRLQVVIDQPLDYSNATVRGQVNDFLDVMRQLELVAGNHSELEENWLEQFKLYTADGLDNLDRVDFARELSLFLHFAESTPLASNVVIDGEGSVVASRFVLQSTAVVSPNEDAQLLADVRAVADSAPFDVFVFNSYFPFFDQFLSIVPDTIWSSALCMVAMAVISYLLLFNIKSVAWICLTIASIYLGILGAMGVMGINMDAIAMICLVLSTGFSVDFSAHIAQHFTFAAEDNMEDRIRSSISAYGYPILQSALSTVLVVVPLLLTTSYILQSFAKILLVIVSLGVVHGLVLLPAFLAQFNDCCCAGCGEEDVDNGADAVAGDDGDGVDTSGTFSLLREEVDEVLIPPSPAATVRESTRISSPLERTFSLTSSWAMDEIVGRKRDQNMMELREQLEEISFKDDSFDMGII